MKISLITTVKNEENLIEEFLNSIEKQTKKPDEVVIVDGGSKDKTMQILKNKTAKANIKYKILSKNGNRSVGRNTAVKNSSNNIIAVTDAGCILDRNWLKNITKPFLVKDVDVVSGFYKPKTKTVFEKCLSTYTCTMEEKLNVKNFLPSSRSIAFKKNAWSKVNGYPENLNFCEDLIFDKKLIEASFRFVCIKNAFVWWPQRSNIFSAALQFFNYAVGDGEARFFRKTLPFLYGRYILGFFIILYIFYAQKYKMLSIAAFLLLLYLAWSIHKNYKFVRNWRGFLYLPLLQITSDICVLVGTTLGFIKSYENK